MGKLTAIGLRKAGDGKHGDGNGLTLIKRGETGKWVYRYSHLGKRREMGLGAWPALSLAEARRSRDVWAAELRAGRDPLDVRDAQRAAERADRDKADPTFAELAQSVFEAHKATLRGDGERGRWLSPLRLYVLPKLGRMRVSQVAATDIADALRPIWRSKHPTAEKAWQRTRMILREGRLMGYPCDPFVADAAQRMLGAVLHKTRSITATRWQDMPALYARLGDGSPVQQCLRWMMLTLVRLDGCAGARVREIDEDVWTVPADRVKGRVGSVSDFRVPISEPALDIVKDAAAVWGDQMFPGRLGTPVTSRALEKCLDRLGESGRPHGFRSAFRTWVQDTDACSYEVAETVLGHVIGTRVERSYARSDLLERRRAVMAAWARHLTGAQENVVRITA